MLSYKLCPFVSWTTSFPLGKAPFLCIRPWAAAGLSHGNLLEPWCIGLGERAWSRYPSASLSASLSALSLSLSMCFCINLCFCIFWVSLRNPWPLSASPWIPMNGISCGGCLHLPVWSSLYRSIEKRAGRISRLVCSCPRIWVALLQSRVTTALSVSVLLFPPFLCFDVSVSQTLPQKWINFDIIPETFTDSVYDHSVVFSH